MLGGYGIVGGHVPLATGAAFTCKFQQTSDISVCFLGDGAVAQGTFHESLNLASRMGLPCIYVVENNKWSISTPVCRTIANSANYLELAADAFGMRFFRLNGMDFYHCFSGFQQAYAWCKDESRPVLVECIADRFRGHSVSDPCAYRTKEEMKLIMEKDPIDCLKKLLLEKMWLSENDYSDLVKEKQKEIDCAVEFADKASWPTMEDSLASVFNDSCVFKK